MLEGNKEKIIPNAEAPPDAAAPRQELQEAPQLQANNGQPEADLTEAYMLAAQETFQAVSEAKLLADEAKLAARARICSKRFKLYQLGQVCLTMDEEQAINRARDEQRLLDALKLRAALKTEGEI